MSMIHPKTPSVQKFFKSRFPEVATVLATCAVVIVFIMTYTLLRSVNHDRRIIELSNVTRVMASNFDRLFQENTINLLRLSIHYSHRPEMSEDEFLEDASIHMSSENSEIVSLLFMDTSYVYRWVVSAPNSGLDTNFLRGMSLIDIDTQVGTEDVRTKTAEMSTQSGRTTCTPVVPLIRGNEGLICFRASRGKDSGKTILGFFTSVIDMKKFFQNSLPIHAKNATTKYIIRIKETSTNKILFSHPDFETVAKTHFLYKSTYSREGGILWDLEVAFLGEKTFSDWVPEIVLSIMILSASIIVGGALSILYFVRTYRKESDDTVYSALQKLRTFENSSSLQDAQVRISSIITNLESFLSGNISRHQ